MPDIGAKTTRFGSRISPIDSGVGRLSVGISEAAHNLGEEIIA
jgi:hypothetical protein